jgi:serine/threonine-protein phosphatase 5
MSTRLQAIFTRLRNSKTKLDHKLTLSDVDFILDSATAVFSRQQFLTESTGIPRLTVCGDTHGQFRDILEIFSQNGDPSDSNPYLFNGDFVDRGDMGIECALILLTAKCLWPTRFWVNRGNHETVEMNNFYGFKKEFENLNYFNKSNKLFELLPIAHLHNNEYFITHGGLPRADFTIDALRQLRVGGEESMGFLWNDPSDQLRGFGPSPRGPGCFQFGPDVTKQFLDKNQLRLLIRSHEVVDAGCEWSQGGKCLTVFSAANYTGGMINSGGYLVIDEAGVHTHSFPGVHYKQIRSRM